MQMKLFPDRRALDYKLARDHILQDPMQSPIRIYAIMKVSAIFGNTVLFNEIKVMTQGGFHHDIRISS